MTLPSETDFIVVGAGVAGLRAAIELAPAGRVLLLAKMELAESATQYAQGGIAVALSDEDEIGLHLQDTLDAGAGLCDPEAARVLVEEGPERIQELIQWGTQFDRQGTKLTFAREGAHSRSRVLHAHGDSTGREIGRALSARARAFDNITLREFGFTTDLLVEDGRVRGISVLDPDGATRHIPASAVLLASGGLGQVFQETTNPDVATGDGVAMAWRAGAAIGDMEFVQFHPTALYLKGAPRFLLSEALRGEGAYLRNAERQRFMPTHHPQAELAPRDVVARAIIHELERSSAPDAVVYLDMTHLDREHLMRRFPRIHATCLRYKLDITADLVPVRPAAHYSMGGVRTDLHGRTSLPGLYSAGEVTATGVHGANRLASNSLLEGLVFGARAGAAMRAENRLHSGAPSAPPAGAHDRSPADGEIEASLARLRRLMWNSVGIVRHGGGLRRAIADLHAMGAALPPPTSRRACEFRNLLQTALLICRSALAREESRGAHYRSDFPHPDDRRFRKHSVIRGDAVSFE